MIGGIHLTVEIRTRFQLKPEHFLRQNELAEYLRRKVTSYLNPILFLKQILVNKKKPCLESSIVLTHKTNVMSRTFERVFTNDRGKDSGAILQL